ncbi:hypothetical protein EDB83DRAFT_2512323 [Lactarius deliciosus]|nr:hypothetical protein EDB83DRAFT_2512323 [Lactarius deliciosus]
MEESTILPGEWPVQIANGGELGAERAREELCNFSTIEVLPEDVLLEIFDFYKLASTTLSWGWHELAHVCRRWRCIVFGSQCRLGLRLLCTYGTPVKKSLDCWLTLPIVVRYNGTAPPSADDEESVVTALQHRDRICEIDLILQGPLTEKVSKIMQEPFPLLERVALRSCDSAVLALPQLLSSACDLVDLQFQRVPSAGYISPEALVAGLSAATKLKTFRLHFASPTSHSSPRSTLPPSFERAVLSTLTSFAFRGSCDYLEDFLSRVSAPSLERTRIGFFDQTNFDILQLAQFLSRSDPQRLPDGAQLLPHNDGICLALTQSGGPPHTPEWLRLSANKCPRFLSSVETFDIATSLTPGNDVDAAQWLGLFRVFSGVVKLHVTWGSVPNVAHALQHVSAEIAVDVLPALRELNFDCVPVPAPQASDIPGVSYRLYQTNDTILRALSYAPNQLSKALNGYIQIVAPTA